MTLVGGTTTFAQPVITAPTAFALPGNAPLSVRGNKRVIRALLAAEGELDDATEAELIALREECFASEDMLEGVRAFGEKRPPNWQGK